MDTVNKGRPRLQDSLRACNGLAKRSCLLCILNVHIVHASPTLPTVPPLSRKSSFLRDNNVNSIISQLYFREIQ